MYYDGVLLLTHAYYSMSRALLCETEKHYARSMDIIDVGRANGISNGVWRHIWWKCAK